jgi:hypothetical protein
MEPMPYSSFKNLPNLGCQLIECEGFGYQVDSGIEPSLVHNRVSRVAACGDRYVSVGLEDRPTMFSSSRRMGAHHTAARHDNDTT